MTSASQSQKPLRPPISASNTWIIRNARELIGYYDRYGIEDWLDEVGDSGMSPQTPDTIHSTMRSHPAGRLESYDPNNTILSLDTILDMESTAAEIEAETERRSGVLCSNDEVVVSSLAMPSGLRTEPDPEIDDGSLRLARYFSHSNDPVLRRRARSDDGSLHTDVEDDNYDGKYELSVYSFDDRDLIRGEYFPRCPSPIPAIRRVSSHTSLSITSSRASITESRDPHQDYFVSPLIRPSAIVLLTDDDESSSQPLLPDVLRPIPQRLGRLLVPQSSRAYRRGSPLVHRKKVETEIPTLTIQFEKTKVAGIKNDDEAEKGMRLPEVYLDELA
jgi:hypothetical protein